MENESNVIIQKDNILQRFWLVLVNPTQAFHNIASRPNWLWPLIILIVVAIPVAYMTVDYQIADQKDVFMKSEKLNEQQKDAIMKRFEEQENKEETFIDHVKMNGMVILYSFARAFLLAAIFYFMGNFIFGGKADFWQVMGVYAWGYLVVIVELLVKVPMMISKETTYVFTSLALFLDPVDPTSWIYKLLNSFDIFDFWRMALWAIGLAVVYKFSQGKAWIIVISWFVIYVAQKIALGAITGGLM